MSSPKVLLEKEIEGWLEDVPDEYADCFLELQEVSDDNISFNIGEEEENFSVTYPQDYPQCKEDR